MARIRSFSDEVSIRRLADGLEAAISERFDGSFDAVVHATGALIVREWLRQFPDASERLRNLVAIAPTNFGSPLAPMARSAAGRAGVALGKIRSGDFDFLTPWSENFLEVGQHLLRDLELASPVCWSLAASEIDDRRWGDGDGSTGAPAVFAVGGLSEYDDRTMGRRRPGSGTDGSVRLAGMALDVDRLTLDLRPNADDAQRVRFDQAPSKMARPLFVMGLNHETVCTGGDPDEIMATQAFTVVVDAVARALEADSPEDYSQWAERSFAVTSDQVSQSPRWSWQQFLVRMRDEAGEPVECDWTLELEVDGRAVGWLEKGAHINSEAPELRCLDAPVTEELESGREVTVNVLLDPHTSYFDYRGVGRVGGVRDAGPAASITIPLGSGEEPVRLFRRMATTLIDIVMEGVPPDPGSDSAIVSFVD